MKKPTASFDVIVLGVGSMGSATCYHLAKQGLRVLGLDQFDSPHQHGSHAGQSRLIRKAYFEHPDYVPLLERAYQNWYALESATGKQVFFPTGLLYAGHPTGALIKGVREASQKYQIAIREISHHDLTDQFNAFSIPEAYDILFEPEAGFLTPEAIITLYKDQAKQFGSILRGNERVLAWSKNGNEILVTTDSGSYWCHKLVITAGPWASQFTPTVARHLDVTRQVLAWVNTHQSKKYVLNSFPCWLIDDDTMPGMYYGFPQLPVQTFGEPSGLKLAYHYPGEVVHPDRVNRVVTDADEANLIAALNRFLPGAYASTHSTKTCLYTNTPDENFIIDFLPDHNKQIVVAAGFSGHGFKFVSVVGEIVSDLIRNGKTDLPIGFLRATRFN